jgi:hypothetical protein
MDQSNHLPQIAQIYDHNFTYNHRMKNNQTKLIVFLVLSVGLCSTVPATAYGKQSSFKNCAMLRKVWPYGVSSSTAKAKRQPIRPKVSPAIYNQNKKLDTNKDGTICELSIQKQPASPSVQELTPTSSTTTPSTSTTSTTIPVRPSGTWKMRWMGLAGDSPLGSDGKIIGGPGLNVVYGEQAEVIICESAGDLPAKLEVKDNGIWKQVASGFRSVSDPSRCASAERSIGFSFYWMVDTMGVTKYRRNGSAYRSRDLEIKITTSNRSVAYARHVGTIENAGVLDLAENLSCQFNGRTDCF